MGVYSLAGETKYLLFRQAQRKAEGRSDTLRPIQQLVSDSSALVVKAVFDSF